MDGTAIVVCDGFFATANGKTAHGLVRGTERYRVLGVIDAPTAGRDAGEVLDGRPRGIPVYASIAEALRAGARPEFCVVGVATSGGRLTPGLKSLLLEAIEAGMSVVNGLHEFLSDDPELAAAAARKGVSIVDVRKIAPAHRAPLLERRDPRGRGAAHRRPRDRLRSRKAHHGAVPARGLPARRDLDRAHLHRPDGLDAGGALRLHLRLDPQRLRLGRARARRRLRLAGVAARPHPPRGPVRAAQSFRSRAARSSSSPARPGA